MTGSHSADGDPTETATRKDHVIDTTRPHSARRYDYWLGGKDNFAADRESADRIANAFPAIRTGVVENRRYLRRVIAYLAQAGIRQFLDIGTGIPTRPNVHDVAQRIAPASRIVYVDNDPLIMVHARALMTSAREGSTAYVQADLRDPEAILTDPELRDTLNLHEPVGLLLVAVLHFLADADDPYKLVARLVDALPPGSHVALSHATFDPLPAHTVDKLQDLTAPGSADGPFRARTRNEVAQFVDGLTLVEPGLVSIVDWQPDQEPKPGASAADTAMYGAVARKP
jgi:hypothetical protein